MGKQRTQIAELAKKNGYHIKGLKTFKGTEGCGGYNATLCQHGRKVAVVINDDSGSEPMWECLGKEDEKKLRDLCARIKPEEFYGKLIPCDLGIFIDELVCDFEEENAWKCKCRNKTLVLLKSHKDNQYLQYNKPYTPELAMVIRQQYGDDLQEIVNERYVQVPTGLVR